MKPAGGPLMSGERLVDVEREDLRDGDEVIVTVRRRGRWTRGEFEGGALANTALYVSTSMQRVERDPELPTTPGAVIWAEERGGGDPGAYELLADDGWYRAGYDDVAGQFHRVHAVLRDPGAES